MTTTHVAVDLMHLTGQRGGTETYAHELYRAMPAVAPDLRFTALVNAGTELPLDWFPGEVRRIPMSGRNRVVWAVAESLVVGPVGRRLGADVLHSPANFGPVFQALPTVLTVHDLLSFRLPDVAGPIGRPVGVLCRRAARAASRVLTDSQASAADISEFIGIGPERVDVVPLAAGRPAPPDPADRLPAAVPDTGRPLVLSTGNRLPHKDFPTLLRAWSQVPADGRPLLVVTGSQGDDPLRPLVTELGLENDVVLLGWVTRGELEALFARADLYVCPSLFEGFGLPVLEAMQRGCPVVASDIPVLREVGGDAARYVAPGDPRTFAAAVQELIASPGQRAALSAAGRARAGRFSWETTARLTAASLRRAVDGARSSGARTTAS
ncbi:MULTISPECIES: glycosyltransferase family 4 protein [unclassified Geodermatophilus]